MTADIAYAIPVRKDICVVFCYYNPTNNPFILKNTMALEAKLKAASIPYFSGELVIGKPVLENPVVSVTSKSSVFYMESLWNLVESKVPVEYSKLCFMDTNLMYSRPDWVDCLSLMLNFYDVIQPFTIMNYLDVSGNVVASQPGAVKSNNTNDVHGNIWGITRSFFNKIGGFLDRSVVDSSLFYSAINGMKIDFPLIDAEYKSYMDSIKANEVRVRYLNCPINSLYNGDIIDYSNLNSILKALSVDWDSLFLLNSSGLWELKEPSLNDMFLDTKNIVDVLSLVAAEPVDEVNLVADNELPTVMPMVLPIDVMNSAMASIMSVPVAPVAPEPVPVPVAPKPAAVPDPVAPVAPKPAAVPVPVAPVPVPVPVAPVPVAPVAPKPAAVPVAPKPAPVAPKPYVFPNPVAPKPTQPRTLPSNLPAAVRNEAARAAAAALVASFKKN